MTLLRRAWLVFLRSDRAHARITSIDTAAARAMPGVVAVLTGADLASAGVKPLATAGRLQAPGRPDSHGPAEAAARP
ncbi:MAG: hypothetical protein U1F67_17800 [Rubrivivax sp.]